MKEGLKIVDSKMHHCGAISRKLKRRQVHLEKMSICDVHKKILDNFKSSSACKTAILNGKAIAMGGVESTICSSVSTVWMAVGDDIKNIKISVIKEIKNTIKNILESKDSIICYVDSRDKKAVDFAEFLGFETPPYHYGHIAQMVLEKDSCEDKRWIL